MAEVDILNLTQHAATAERVAEGVGEPADKEAIQKLITFDELPSTEEMVARAARLADLVAKEGAEVAMIGGAPFFMSTLERALKERGVCTVYAFSRRESVDTPQPDGSVKKTQVFRHAGWVEV